MEIPAWKRSDPLPKRIKNGAEGAAQQSPGRRANESPGPGKNQWRAALGAPGPRPGPIAQKPLARSPGWSRPRTDPIAQKPMARSPGWSRPTHRPHSRKTNGAQPWVVPVHAPAPLPERRCAALGENVHESVSGSTRRARLGGLRPLCAILVNRATGCPQPMKRPQKRQKSRNATEPFSTKGFFID